MNNSKHLFDAMQEARIAANAEQKAKTAAQRQASLKARRKAAGLVQVKVWVHPDWREYVKGVAAARQRPFTLVERVQQYVDTLPPELQGIITDV